ncbi:MAG: MXAN_5187 C-terminal domain-containing protein, partial [Polyangiales bacterium]
PAARPASPPKPTAQGAGARAAVGGESFSSADIDRVYSQYVAARERNAERTDNVKRETIEKSIRGMLPQLEKKHAGHKIDFEVVVKDGKVALKPVPK